MSSTLRIAVVGEGITDYVVLSAAIESMLNGRPFILNHLQPEGSVAFTGGGDAGPLGGGWKGVYRWCLQSALRGGGRLSGDPLFVKHDLLVLHLDADVAGEDPANARNDPIPGLAGQLPCEQPCPPASASSNALRAAMLSWLGETGTPPRTVLCTPSKSTEAWVMAVCFPRDREMARKGWECHPKPANRLAQQPKHERFSKTHADYEKRKPELQARWPDVVAKLSEAARFQNDFTAAFHALPTA
jgi:hypothetical protein